MASKIGTRGKKLEGIQAMQNRISALRDAVAFKESQDVMAQVSNFGAQTIRIGVRSQNWPHEVLEDVFSYNKLPPEKLRGGPSTLFGIRKRGSKHPWAKGYVEWGTRTGKIVGESLATMYEYGTTKQTARPVMRPAISITRSMAKGVIESGFRAILERHSTK